ncbi:hypothetical protein D9758_005456 [Tetrapyrgos nigripes]|uniref:Fork-head domain-containing protein n=1 Tax=Tetrapyrgos nigripes TaxID=182062 RepID=A0A8H5GIB0_9AGAR|nr:hypothetical protein D9758_005456 [Tetrapyrgos nigripes]
MLFTTRPMESQTSIHVSPPVDGALRHKMSDISSDASYTPVKIEYSPYGSLLSYEDSSYELGPSESLPSQTIEYATYFDGPSYISPVFNESGLDPLPTYNTSFDGTLDPRAFDYGPETYYTEPTHTSTDGNCYCPKCATTLGFPTYSGCFYCATHPQCTSSFPEQDVKPTWDVTPTYPVPPTILPVTSPSQELSPLVSPNLYPVDSVDSVPPTQSSSPDIWDYIHDPSDSNDDATWNLCSGVGEQLREMFRIPAGIPLDLRALPDSPIPGEKPPVNYEAIVAMAIYGSPNKRLHLQAIYKAITERYAYFRDCPEKSWKNSIRHLLSLYGMFVARPKGEGDDPRAKGGVWTLDPCCMPKYTRDRKRRKQNGKRSKKSSLNSSSSSSDGYSPSLSNSSSPSDYWSPDSDGYSALSPHSATGGSPTSSAVAGRRSKRNSKRGPYNPAEKKPRTTRQICRA